MGFSAIPVRSLSLARVSDPPARTLWLQLAARFKEMMQPLSTPPACHLFECRANPLACALSRSICLLPRSPRLSCSHAPALSRSICLLPRSHAPTLPRSHAPTLPRSHTPTLPICLLPRTVSQAFGREFCGCACEVLVQAGNARATVRAQLRGAQDLHLHGTSSSDEPRAAAGVQGLQCRANMLTDEARLQTTALRLFRGGSEEAPRRGKIVVERGGIVDYRPIKSPPDMDPAGEGGGEVYYGQDPR